MGQRTINSMDDSMNGYRKAGKECPAYEMSNSANQLLPYGHAYFCSLGEIGGGGLKDAGGLAAGNFWNV